MTMLRQEKGACTYSKAYGRKSNFLTASYSTSSLILITAQREDPGAGNLTFASKCAKESGIASFFLKISAVLVAKLTP
ncbi:MAG: hypothetical protein WA996_19810 [Candidatus Promineifilaceae bacterium]